MAMRMTSGDDLFPFPSENLHIPGHDGSATCAFPFNLLLPPLQYSFLYSIIWLLSDYHLWQRADNVEMMS